MVHSKFQNTNVRVPEISVNHYDGEKKIKSLTAVQSQQQEPIKRGSQCMQSSIVDPKEVGHNVYILAHQLARHNEELADLLNADKVKDEKVRDALTFYKEHTAQIEVSYISLESLFLRFILDCSKRS